MKMARKIPIDMRDVLRTGRFDCLQIGQTKEIILHNFPDPDAWGGSSEQSVIIEGSPIWRYGNIELHFDGPRLFLIFSDYLDELQGGESLAVDPWFLHRPEKMTLLEVIRTLNDERIDFTKKTRNHGESEDVTLVLASGVALQFDRRAPTMRSFEQPEGPVVDPNEMRLSCFSIMTPLGE